MDVARSRKAAGSERRLPLHRLIEQYLRDLIGAPDIRPGDRVPSERALAERLNANRMTVRKAVDRLVAQGLLERDGTSGTRVTRPRVVRPADAHTSLGIARIVRSGGGSPGNKLIHFVASRADVRIAKWLAVAEGEPIIVIRRLWMVDDVPFCIETSHLPAGLVPGLAAEDLSAGQSLYGLLRARFGIETLHGERLISVTSCTELEARLLGLDRGAPALLLRLRASDASDRPVEYLASVNHPGRVQFRSAKAELPS
ncbi:MAG: GntR family transcriptional regulator [Rhodospirillales bacterium]|nr:GntR family transcriptional regulator [Rhodospirillales bacterium]